MTFCWPQISKYTAGVGLFYNMEPFESVLMVNLVLLAGGNVKKSPNQASICLFFRIFAQL